MIYKFVRLNQTRIADMFVMMMMMAMMAAMAVMAAMAAMAAMTAIMGMVAMAAMMMFVHALHLHQKICILVPYGYPAIPCSAWALVRSSVTKRCSHLLMCLRCK